MEDLENQASASHAQLERRHRVFAVAAVVRTPLEIEADDEGAETVAVEAFDVGDPRVNVRGCACDYG